MKDIKKRLEINDYFPDAPEGDREAAIKAVNLIVATSQEHHDLAVKSMEKAVKLVEPIMEKTFVWEVERFLKDKP